MKNLFSLTLFLSISLVYNAQKEDFLLNSYSKEELKEIKTANPEKYDLLEYALEHGLTVEPYIESKHFELEKVSFKSKSLKPAFTDFGLKIKDKRQNFYWKDNDVVISVMSYGALKHLKTLKR